MYKSQPYYIKNNTSSFVGQKRMSTMIYYLFPRASIFLSTSCAVSYSDSFHVSTFSNSLCTYKKELMSYAFQTISDWKNICVRNNVYSYLNEVSSLTKSNIFFELLEIFQLLDISYTHSLEMQCLHFCKDTYSFNEYFRSQFKNDKYFLFDKSFSIEDFPSIRTPLFDLVFCQAFEDDEYQNAINIILQSCISMCTLQKSGIMIIKCGDLFTSLSLQALMLISFFFEKTYFIKPSASVPTFSDKYIVCTNFIYDGISDKLYNILHNLYKSVLQCPPNKFVTQILSNNVPLFIVHKMEEINSIFGQTQLECMHNLVSEVENNVNTDIEFRKPCKLWCEKFNIPFTK